MEVKDYRPPFLEALDQAYYFRLKNVMLFTGDVDGLFWNKKAGDFFITLEQTFNIELKDKFNVIRMDMANGISFVDEENEKEIIRICESTDGVYVPDSRVRNLKKLIDDNRHNPLPTLVLLKGISDATDRLKRIEKSVKPLVVIIPWAGAIFPEGDFSRLSELDRQRLVFFLNWITDPLFVRSKNLIILVNPVRSEVNSKIVGLSNATHIEIQLPDEKERKLFTNVFTESKDIEFEGGKEFFCRDTAGLTITSIKDMLEVASRSGNKVMKKDVVAEVNNVLRIKLGDVIRIKYPTHTPDDIIGYGQTKEIFKSIFERCEDPETAVSAILVCGPNGGGKTFQLEAYAHDSGRVVIELANLRGSLFGETDRFTELLRFHITTLGKILILVDEAHTAFGSVHAKEVHPTERRLAGNIIKMMGDPFLLGKVVWALMTTRPDELDPDIKSRSPIQVPILDLEGEARKKFVAEMFKRKNIILQEDELNDIFKQTGYYSARDYRNLVVEVLAQRRKKSEINPSDVLKGWQASKSIETQRLFQTLIAAQHCTYRQLLPKEFQEMSDRDIEEKIRTLKFLLNV